MRAVGVDGWKDAWVAVALQDGAYDEAFTAASFEAVLAWASQAKAIGVDIPIGSEPDAMRRLDEEARRFIGARRSSIFPMPPLAALEKPTYAAALAACRRLCGKGLSKQAYGLRTKILEVAEHAQRDARIVEMHPEVSFTAMGGGVELRFSKKCWSGFMARLQLLRRAGIEIPPEIGPAGLASVDDVLDAAAVAWSAARRARDEAVPITTGARDRGRQLAIWY